MCRLHVLQYVISVRWLFQGFQSAALVKARAQRPGIDGAYPDCPCVRRKSNSSYVLDRFSDSWDTEDGEIYTLTIDGSTKVVPVDYGFNRCSDWDAADEACSVMERPSWCDNKWCYVDAATCKRPFRASSQFPGYSYSYQTCGYLDHYTSPRSQEWNISEPIYAWAVGHTAQENVGSGSTFLDMFLHFAALVIEESGIGKKNIRYKTTLSNASRRATSGSFTGCVHDIALGNLDVCLGDFWDTEERQSFGTASFVPVSLEETLLIGPVKEEDSQDLLNMIGKTFSPFDLGLWAMIFSVVVLVSISMLVFEHGRPGGDFDEQKLCRDFLKSLYLATLSIVNSGVSYTSVTASGRAISVGYGVFILIAISLFTAQTASVLIQKSMVVQVNSIEAALEQSLRICYSTGMQPMIESKYNRMRQLGIAVDSTLFEDFANLMNDGTCEFAIVGEVWPGHVWEAGEHCNFQFLGAPVLSFPVGYWVRNDLHHQFTWAVSVLRGRGDLAKTERAYKEADACKEDSSRRNAGGTGIPDSGETQVDSGPEPLRAYNMLGTVTVLCFFIGLAGAIRLAETMCCGVSEEDAELVNLVEENALDLEKQTSTLLEHSATVMATFARHVGTNNDEDQVLEEKTLKLVSHANEIVASFSALLNVKASGDVMDQPEVADQEIKGNEISI